MSRLTASALAASFAALVPSAAHAVCSTNALHKAWGPYWVERNTTGHCLIYARQYSCALSGGFRTENASTLLATVTGGTPSTSCESVAGFDAAIASIASRYAPSTFPTDGYQCDTTFVDNDQDGVAQCIDENDNDPRLWVKINATERACDGKDNDNDGTIDDGFTACAKDNKRLRHPSLLQGDGQASANLVSGALLRSDMLLNISGPFSALPLYLSYNHLSAANDVGLGRGFKHNFGVYLAQQPSGDDRWRVERGDGSEEYFRCTAFAADMVCAVDDHVWGGNLRRVSGVFEYYPGDGTVYRFEDTVKTNGKRNYNTRKNAVGQMLESATFDAGGLITKVESANPALYYSFAYDASKMLDLVRLGSSGSNTVLDFDVGNGAGWFRLDKVKFTPTLGTVDADTFLAYAYDATSKNLLNVTQKLDASTTLTTSVYTYDATTGRVATMKDARKDLTLSWAGLPATVSVTYNVAASGNPTTSFTLNGSWVTTRSSDVRMGGSGARTTKRDAFGRVSCEETDDSRMSKPAYGDSRWAVRTDLYGKSGDCASGGTIDHKVWLSYEYDGNVQTPRVAWTRELSAFNPAADCSGVSLPSGCTETKYQYVSPTDDRIQWVTQTGYTKLVNDLVVQQIRKERTYYYGLDTTTCNAVSTTDVYAGLPCRQETQDGAAAVFEQADFTYYPTSPSGNNVGQLKTSRSFKAAGTSLTTSYASYNLFGAATSITAPTTVVTTLAFNGWNAVTSRTETAALLDDVVPPGTLSRVTSTTYNKLRRADTVTLPKGNKQVYRYFTGSTDYARTKAFANADAAGNLLEIRRYDYDQLGNRTEEKILDSINGSTPCADENCTTYEVRRQSKLNARRQTINTYLHAADTADPPDGTATYAYTNGQLNSVTDYLGQVSGTGYDDQGRVATTTGDSGGLNATTSYTYDIHDRMLTTSSPTTVETRTEHDDFGQLVLDSSPTRGDLRYEYDTRGFQTKMQRSSYKSAANAESTCATSDWLSRQLTRNDGCDGTTEWSFFYDGDSLPASTCPTASKQTGRLSHFVKSDTFERVLCYHPNGMLYSKFELDTSVWSTSNAKGTTRIYDLNGNLTKEYLHDSPNGHTNAREIEYVYDATLKDRIQYVRQKLTSSGTWTYLTSNVTNPTYFAFGGFKSILYSNGVTETNTRDKAYRLTRRLAAVGASPVLTDLNLTYDVGGNITTYDDSLGYRHTKYFAAYDRLSRLRCTSRQAIGASCTGTSPWADGFEESFDYDRSGNRTKRRYGEFHDGGPRSVHLRHRHGHHRQRQFGRLDQGDEQRLPRRHHHREPAGQHAVHLRLAVGPGGLDARRVPDGGEPQLHPVPRPLPEGRLLQQPQDLLPVHADRRGRHVLRAEAAQPVLRLRQRVPPAAEELRLPRGPPHRRHPLHPGLGGERADRGRDLLGQHRPAWHADPGLRLEPHRALALGERSLWARSAGGVHGGAPGREPRRQHREPVQHVLLHGLRWRMRAVHHGLFGGTVHRRIVAGGSLDQDVQPGWGQRRAGAFQRVQREGWNFPDREGLC